MDKRQIFKRELPKYMERAGMKQVDLAKALGMSKSTVHCWITGKAFPEIDTIQKIADALGCRTDDLLVEEQSLSFRDLLVGAPRPFHPSVMDQLRTRPEPTPKEDAEMAWLWQTATLQEKRTIIKFLKSMKEVDYER